jgi:polysaccharide biosynthesis transport protein
MNPESKAHGEFVRPMLEPGVILSAAAPSQAPRVVTGPSGGVPSPTSAATMSPMSILRALRRRQLLALGVAILLTSIGGPAAWFLVPPAKFTTQARLQVAAQPPRVLFQTEENGVGDYHRYQTTQQTLVASRLVLNAALQDPKVGLSRTIREQADPIAWLQKELKIVFVAGSEVMEIALSGNDPNEITDLVNAVKSAYMDEVVNVDTKLRAQRHSKLKQIGEKYAEMLKERRETMRKLAETVGSDDRKTLALRQQYAMEHVAYLQKELLEIQSQKRRAEARNKMRSRREETTGETSAPTITEVDIERAIDQDPDIANLIGKVADLEEKFNMEKAHLGRVARNAASDPVLVRMRGELGATRKSLASRRKEMRSQVIRQLEKQEKVEQLAQSGETEQDLAMLNELEQGLNGELKSISVGNQALNVKTLDLQELQDTVAQMRNAADKVGAEVEALNVELDAPARIRLIEDAAVPLTRDEKKRLMMIGMITGGSFFAGLFGIALLEVLNRKVDTAEEVPIELGLTIVGALPVLPSRAHRGGAIARRDTEKDRFRQNLLLESVDATRTMLVHAASTGSHRVVMIGSAVAAEGKTSLSSYLATSLARSGLRTLLVDADLRKPSIHRLYDLPLSPGLSELLRGEVDLADAISATPIENLKVLAGGRCDRQTIRVLAQGCLGPLLGQLKEQFDFVIVDSSPILPVADASIIAQYVDAVLFSIFGDVSSKTKVFAAIQRLRCLGVPILGAVVTGGQGTSYGNNYYGSEYSYAGLPESVDDLSETRS